MPTSPDGTAPPLRLVTGAETPPDGVRPPAAVGPRAPARPQPRLEIPPCGLDAVAALQRELGIGRVLAQILVRRGLCTPALARSFLEAADEHPPDAFAGIDEAIEVVRRHIARGARIVVHGDYDVDGICATAVTVRALRSLGANVGWFLPSRLEDGYGLAPPTVERLAAQGTELMVTVDCGITAVREVELARAAGLDVVVTDHHAPAADGRLPACPIVHPSVGAYPCTELCGTAVAFKFAQALGAPSTEEDLELVALATVADLVPLRGENRRLVRAGIAALANTSKPGLRALLEVSGSDPSSLDARVLGFRLAPRLNAAGRMRRADAALELLLSDDVARAAVIAAELDALNAERRLIEERTTWEAEALVARLGHRHAYVLAAEHWHPGVIGIVASRIAERYHRPAVLVALDGDRLGQGSCRSIPGFDLLAGLNAVAPHLQRHGGHRAAAGLAIAPNRLSAFSEALEDHARTVLSEEHLRPVVCVDAIVSAAELGLPLTNELEQLEPHGVGNPQPRLLVPGARFEGTRAVGEGRHAVFTAVSGGARARAVSFRCDGRVPGDSGEPLNAVFVLERNEWRGVVEPRLVLRHAQPCAGAPIEVIGEPASYLDAVFAELDAPLDATPPAALAERARGERRVLDRRGASALVVLQEALCSGEAVLAVCADTGRRLAGLQARVGGLALVSYAALERRPELAGAYPQLVALDPPGSRPEEALLRHGEGRTHLAWGEPELRFALQMHELEYGLRASLASFYRELKARGRAAGEELERLLRGSGPHGRSHRLAARLIRVLAELELVSLDRQCRELILADATRTSLERSPAYRLYQQRYEDGKTFLSAAELRPSG